VHARHPNAVGRQRDSRTECELANVLGAGHDVAAHVVGVVGDHLRGGADGVSDDVVAESGGEPLDLRDDRRGGVAGVAVGDVRVGP